MPRVPASALGMALPKAPSSPQQSPQVLQARPGPAVEAQERLLLFRLLPGGPWLVAQASLGPARVSEGKRAGGRRENQSCAEVAWLP